MSSSLSPQEDVMILPTSDGWTPPDLLSVPSIVLDMIRNEPYPIYRPVTRESLNDEAWLELTPGPTPTSNWLIPNILLITIAPSRLDDDELTALLLEAGVTLFVNLLPSSHRVLYSDRVDSILASHNLTDTKHVSLYESEIRNLAAPSLDQAQGIVTRVLEEFHAGGVVAIHCRSGCGRAGTVGACVLGSVYPSLALSEILARVQASHNARKRYLGRKPFLASPETRLQRLFIAEFLGVERCDVPNLLPGLGEVRREPEKPPRMPLPGRVYQIRSKCSGHVLGILSHEVPDTLTESGTLLQGIPIRQIPKIQILDPESPHPDLPSQLFLTRLNLDDGTWTFQHLSTGLVLDISGRETDLGVLVQLWVADGTSSQRFYVNPRQLDFESDVEGEGDNENDGGGWRITAQCSSMSVDVPYNTTESNALIHQWVENKSFAQMWFFDEVCV